MSEILQNTQSTAAHPKPLTTNLQKVFLCTKDTSKWQQTLNIHDKNLESEIIMNWAFMQDILINQSGTGCLNVYLVDVM